MHDTILQQGINLMLFGMGTVFLFLTLLVFAVWAMSWVVATFFAEPEEKVSDYSPVTVVNKPSGGIDPNVLTVIQDAIHQHRAKLKL